MAFVVGVKAARGAVAQRQEMVPMAQYLVSVLADSSQLATEQEMTAIRAFNLRLKAEGHWVFAGGLGSPDTATVVDGRDGEALFTDGPYLESKEYIIGFWVIEAADLDVALRLAGLGSKHCNRRVEVRPVLGA
ncbi:YciI family protein [Kitasatospora indigofera]|nr:YciI family protein [Kitasatospora indigofera]